MHCMLRLSPLIAVLLAGCAVLSTPPATLSPQVLGLTEARAPAFADGAWWRALGDPALDRLVAQALAANPRLTLADAKIRAAEAGRAVAAAGGGPNVGFAYSRNRQRYSADSIYPPPIGGSWQTLEEIGLKLDWQVDLWGQVSERVAAEAGQVAAARFDAELARQWLCAEVTAQYLALRVAKAQQALATEAVTLARSRDKQVQWRVKAGLSDPASLSGARASLAAAEATLAPWDGEVTATRAALAALTVQPLSAIPADTPTAWPEWTLDTAGLSLSAISRRPELAAARQGVEAAAHRVRAARADFYPDLSLSLLLGLTSLNPATLFDAASRELGVTPALSLPLYRAGGLQGRLDAEQAAYAAAVAQYNQTLLDVAGQSASALAKTQAAARADAAAADAARGAEQQARAAEVLFAAGLAARDDALAAAEGALSARQTWLSVRGERLQAQLALVRALGEVPESPAEKP